MKFDKKSLSQKYFQMFFICIFSLLTIDSFAAIVQRNAVGPAPRNSRAGTTNTIKTNVENTIVSEPIVVDTETVETVNIENKSSQFNTALNSVTNISGSDTSAKSRSEMIRAQRAALDAADSESVSNLITTISGGEKCDSDLRKCMSEKCGKDFSKCSTDSDTDWGIKIDACKKTAECSVAEFVILSREIKSDRDTNSDMSSYTQIINCGNEYNSCIIAECGTKLEKCINKEFSDSVIAKCEKKSDDCININNNLSAKTRSVFGTLRINAAEQIQQDEKRLYALREQMKSECKSMGAMFDERSLDCVYTVNFWANNSSAPVASKKAYAGNSFDCNPDWFGIDITTFKENAYRLTSSQKSASSGMMGAGVGVGVGALTSGAIDRATSTSATKQMTAE